MTNRQCKACGIGEFGADQHEELKNFRKHLICGYCTLEWLKRERILGHRVTFEEFNAGIPILKKKIIKR